MQSHLRDLLKPIDVSTRKSLLQTVVNCRKLFDMAKPLGENIKQARIKRAMRRKELAAAIGKSYAHVANIENGLTTAAPETLVDIAKTLGIPIERAMDSDWGTEDDSAPQPQPKREPNPTTHPEPARPVPPQRPTKTKPRVQGAAA
jgi:transcriptional regulator with XRE-family HTH domain